MNRRTMQAEVQATLCRLGARSGARSSLHIEFMQAES